MIGHFKISAVVDDNGRLILFFNGRYRYLESRLAGSFCFFVGWLVGFVGWLVVFFPSFEVELK